MDTLLADAELAVHHPVTKRRKWTPQEERVLREEVELKAGTTVPRRQFCHELITKNPSLFIGKSKIDTQDKYRLIIRKLKDEDIVHL